MGENKLTKEGREKIFSAMSKIWLLLMIATMCIFMKNKNIYADTTIGVPEDISVEMGNMKFVVYYFTGDNCKNIEFRKPSDPDDQSLKIRITQKQIGDGYAYYGVQYFGYKEDYINVIPYDVDTGTVWNRYQVHVESPTIDINSCNGQEIQFSFYSFNDENIDIGYYGIDSTIYHGDGLKYTKTLYGGYSDANDVFNTDKTIWMYKYDCKLTLYTNGTYNALLYGSNILSRLNLNIHDHIAGEAEKEDIVEPTCGDFGSYNSVIRCTQCNTILSWSTESIEPTGNHNIVIDKAVDPTCTEDGKTEGSHCTSCGNAIKEQQIIPATGHQYGAYTITLYPTCTSSGYKVRYCQKCGAQDWAYIPLTDHTYTQKIISPTCTSMGYTVYTCIDCGQRYYDNYISETGHSWNDWEITKQPTCTESGKKIHTCNTCGESEIEVINKLGHNEVLDKEIQATCVEKGKTEGSHCSRCGESLKEQKTIPETGHKWTEWKVDKEATCTEKGSKTRECTLCGTKESIDIEAKGHIGADEFIIDKEPTCTEDGEKTIRCTQCGEIKEKQTIQATGHKWTEWEVVNESNCTEKGSKTRNCKICGFTESTEVEAKGHIWADEFTIDKDPTCVNNGAKSIHCMVCGISKDSQIISAYGHKYGSWKTMKSATVFQKGVQQRNCSKCNNKQQRIIEKLKPTLKVSKNKITLKVKKSVGIKVWGLAKGDSIKSWKTGNKKVATVTKNGKVTAKKKGKTTITVTLKSGKTAKINVTVK